MELYLKYLKLDKTPISECEVAFECEDSLYRLYYNKNLENKSFSACGLRIVNSYPIYSSSWDRKDIIVEQLFYASAHCGGPRQFSFDFDVLLPEFDGLSIMVKKLRDIELEMFGDCE